MEMLTTQSVERIDWGANAGLPALAETLRAEYAANDPFPHIVIDSLFPNRLLDKVALEANKVQHNSHIGSTGSRRKYTTANLESMGATTRQFLADLNSASFLRFLERLTGITGLIPCHRTLKKRSKRTRRVTQFHFMEMARDWSRSDRFRCRLMIVILRDLGSWRIKGDILLILCPAHCLGSKHGNNNHLVRLVQLQASEDPTAFRQTHSREK